MSETTKPGAGSTEAAGTQTGTADTKAGTDAAATAAAAAEKKVADDAAAKATADAAAAKAAETKPAETSSATTGKPDAAAAASTVPDKYELKVPDAGKAYVDAADLKFLETAARTNGWSNEDAQAALEEHIATVAAQSERYAAATKADPTYGGDKFDETQRLARRVIDKVRPVGHDRRENFLAFLGRGGAGNHIEVISFLADLGKAMGEDAPSAQRSVQTGGSSDVAASFYDHPTSVAANKA